jgi:hypothetical protein
MIGIFELSLKIFWVFVCPELPKWLHMVTLELDDFNVILPLFLVVVHDMSQILLLVLGEYFLYE